MTVEIANTSLKDQFLEHVYGGDQQALHNFLDRQNISDVAELIDEYPEQTSEILGNLSIHRAISTFKILDFPTQKHITQILSPSKTAELLNGLPADDRTSFLEDLPSEVVKELIRTLDPEERKITLALLGYPESSVGRLMTPDYIAVQKDWTIRQVIRHIRDVGKDSETIDVIYVVDDKGIFIDDIRIREIILADPDKKVEDVIDNRFIFLNVNDDQETAAQAFKMNNRVALPVLDKNKILLGIVTIDDILWMTTEEFTEDIQKIGGTEALDQPYLETPFFQLIRKRVGWLVILFFSEMLTATASAEVNPGETRIIAEDRQVTRLGESVFRSGRIAKDALDEFVVMRFAEIVSEGRLSQIVERVLGPEAQGRNFGGDSLRRFASELTSRLSDLQPPVSERI